MKKSIRMLILGDEGYTNITQPAAFTRSLPFTVQQNGRNFRVNPSWTISGSRPAGKAYYVSTAGNDTNDGLTAGAPLRKMITAIGKADIVEMYLIDATGAGFGSTNGFGSGSAFTKAVSIIPYVEGQRITVGGFAEGLSYSLDSAPNDHTYKVARSNVAAVWDFLNIDAHGDATKLVSQANEAAVEANPGSYYTDNVTLYIRTVDSRAPDFNLRVMFSTISQAGRMVGNFTFYMKNIDLIGGETTAMVHGSGAGQNCIGYYDGCTFKYGRTGNGLTLTGGTAYLQNCVAACNALDGFNYHAANGVLPQIAEVGGCVGRDNGTAGDTIDNGSTIHDGGNIVRIGTEVMRSVGRPIHDVGTATLSWNLGVYSHDSAASPQLANFGAGTGGTSSTLMWLDCCRSIGSGTDIDVDAGCTVYTRNFQKDASNAGAGTVTGY